MDTFIEFSKRLRGEAGEKWAKSIPDVINKYEQKWSISVGKPFTLSYNYAAPAKKSDGTEVVLKIGFPKDTEFISETAALEIFNGQAAVKILEKDIEHAVILLERVLPGTSVDKIENTEEQTRIAVGVLKQLWKKAPNTEALIPLERWFEGFTRYRMKFETSSGPIPHDLFTKAEKLFANLLETTTTSQLLHGDFNHNNILLSNRHGWLIIDPKGVIGDPLYDTSVFLYNYLPNISETSSVKEVVEKSIDVFSKELDVDRNRIIHWGIAQAVLSVIWSLEDREDVWSEPLEVAKLLSSL